MTPASSKIFFLMSVSPLGNGGEKSLTHHCIRKSVTTHCRFSGRIPGPLTRCRTLIGNPDVFSRILIHGRDNKNILANKA